MIKLEIREQDDQGEIIATYDGVSIEPGIFRDEHASMVSGFTARDAAGELLGYLLVGLHPFGSSEKPAIAIKESGIAFTGLAAYFNDNRSPFGYLHYTRTENDGSYPPGPSADKQKQHWSLEFHEDIPN